MSLFISIDCVSKVKDEDKEEFAQYAGTTITETTEPSCKYVVYEEWRFTNGVPNIITQLGVPVTYTDPYNDCNVPAYVCVSERIWDAEVADAICCWFDENLKTELGCPEMGYQITITREICEKLHAECIAALQESRQELPKVMPLYNEECFTDKSYMSRHFIEIDNVCDAVARILKNADWENEIYLYSVN